MVQSGGQYLHCAQHRCGEIPGRLQTSPVQGDAGTIKSCRGMQVRSAELKRTLSVIKSSQIINKIIVQKNQVWNISPQSF